jgi:galactokinase
MTTLQETVVQRFRTLFGQEPAFVVRAPGRVNLIGEHTDYNDGFVMPMAIERAVYIALRPRKDERVMITSLNFDTPFEFDLHAFTRADTMNPLEYVKGVAHYLQAQGHKLRGWEGVMAGDVPIGAGLSSSAALELATARAFSAVSKFAWDAPKMALLSQKAENDWVGVKCGIMDQMISATGKANHAVLIDCRTLETQALPLPPKTLVVILDTNTRRGLVESAYNERRAQCEEAARFFGVPALRDVTLADFQARSGGLAPLVAQRAKHVISENERVLAARTAMLAGDAKTLGALMIASHESLRDDFAVSSDALNRVVACALEHSACYGARMTGAGFGGCGVALVDEAHVESFLAHVESWYQARMAEDASVLRPSVYVTRATDGANLL